MSIKIVGECNKCHLTSELNANHCERCRHRIKCQIFTFTVDNELKNTRLRTIPKFNYVEWTWDKVSLAFEILMKSVIRCDASGMGS